jgi:hypothetical protein
VAVCDNTNLIKAHYVSYVKAAKENGFNVVVLTVGEIKDPEFQRICANRNKHGLDWNAIQRQASKFEF